MTKQAAIRKIAQFIVYRDMAKQAQWPQQQQWSSSAQRARDLARLSAQKYNTHENNRQLNSPPLVGSMTGQSVPSWATSLAKSMTGLQPAGQHSERDSNAELLQALREVGYGTPYATGEAGASAGQRVLDDIEAAGAGYQNPGSIALNTTSDPMSPGASAGQQVLQDIGFDPNAQYVNPLEAYFGQPLGVSTEGVGRHSWASIDNNFRGGSGGLESIPGYENWSMPTIPTPSIDAQMQFTNPYTE